MRHDAGRDPRQDDLAAAQHVALEHAAGGEVRVGEDVRNRVDLGHRHAVCVHRRDDLERITVAELSSKMAAGQLTSVQATRAYINRIAATNARG